MLLFGSSRNLLSSSFCVRPTCVVVRRRRRRWVKKKRLRGDSGVFFYVDFVLPEFRFVRGKWAEGHPLMLYVSLQKIRIWLTARAQLCSYAEACGTFALLKRHAPIPHTVVGLPTRRYYAWELVKITFSPIEMSLFWLCVWLHLHMNHLRFIVPSGNYCVPICPVESMNTEQWSCTSVSFPSMISFNDSNASCSSDCVSL